MAAGRLRRLEDVRLSERQSWFRPIDGRRAGRRARRTQRPRPAPPPGPPASARAAAPAPARCEALEAGHGRPLRRGPRARIPSAPFRRPALGRVAETPAPAGPRALPAGPARPPRERRPTMLLLSPRSALLSVYCPQLFLILSSGSYL